MRVLQIEFVTRPKTTLGFCVCVYVCVVCVTVHWLQVSDAFLTVSHGQKL